MKILSSSNVRARLDQIVDQIIRTGKPVVVARGNHHVIIRSCESIKEDAGLTEAIQKAVRKHRAGKRRRK